MRWLIHTAVLSALRNEVKTAVFPRVRPQSHRKGLASQGDMYEYVVSTPA